MPWYILFLYKFRIIKSFSTSFISLKQGYFFEKSLEKFKQMQLLNQCQPKFNFSKSKFKELAIYLLTCVFCESFSTLVDNQIYKFNSF